MMLIFFLGLFFGVLIGTLVTAIFALEKECSEDGRDKMDKDND